MKEKRTREVEAMVDICNICTKEITSRPSNSEAGRRRIPMINGLFKITDFDAHDACVNRVIREAFKKYI